MEEKSFDDRLKETELAIKEAELAKIKSEDEKVNAETDLVRKQVNENWYSGKSLGQIAAVALTVFALYTGIDQFFLTEVKQKEAKLAELQTKLLKARGDSLSMEIDSRRIRLTLLHAFGHLPDSLYDNALKQYWMIKWNDYFDRQFNPEGKGIENKFQEEDSVIYDAKIDLTWQGGSKFNKQEKWKDALAYVDSLNARKYAGYNDWRLPTLEEAMSLMKPKTLVSKISRIDSLYADPLFKGTPVIWTSNKLSASRPWYVRFNRGRCDNVVDRNLYVRAVR